MNEFMCRINPDAYIRTMTRKDFMELPQIDDDLYYCDSLILIPNFGKNKLHETGYRNMYGVTVIKDIIPRYLITGWSDLIILQDNCRIDCLPKTGFMRIRSKFGSDLLKVEIEGSDMTVESTSITTLTDFIESEGDRLFVESKLGYKLPSTLKKEAAELAEEDLELEREMYGYSKIE